MSSSNLRQCAKEFYEGKLQYLMKRSIQDYEIETLNGLWNKLRILDHTERFLCIKSLLSEENSYQTFIDVGCGRGPVIWHNFGILQKYSYILAVDLNPIIINRNKELFRKKYPSIPIDFCLCDASYLPLKNNSFDISVCTEVLEHLPDYQSGVRELSRVSKKEIILSIPDAGISPLDYDFTKSGHLHVIKTSKLVTILRNEDWSTKDHYRISVILKFIERKVIRRIEKNWHKLALHIAKIIMIVELKCGRILVRLSLPKQFSGFHIFKFVKT